MDEGFVISNPIQRMMWWKYLAFECGISPNDFNRSTISDIRAIMTIKGAMGAKAQRNKKVQDMMNKVRFN